jgi:hypothetical protein
MTNFSPLVIPWPRIEICTIVLMGIVPGLAARATTT